jgi:hypothetical protein
VCATVWHSPCAFSSLIAQGLLALAVASSTASGAFKRGVLGICTIYHILIVAHTFHHTKAVKKPTAIAHAVLAVVSAWGWTPQAQPVDCCFLL